MAILLKQSQTAQVLLFLLVSSTDHVTGVTGLTPTVKLSKNGATGVSPSGAVSEVDAANHPGLYKVAGNATDTGTLGPLALHATGTGADPTDVLYEVVAYDPQDSVRLGQTALPNAAAGANGGLPTGNASGQVAVATIATGAITAGSIAADAIGASELAADAVAEIQSGLMTSAGYTAPDNVGIAAIKAKTDNLPSDPADASDMATAFGVVGAVLSTIDGRLDTEIPAIKAKTDLIPANPSAVGDIPSAAAIATQVLDTSLLETGISVRMALRGIARVLLAKVSGAGSTTFTVRDLLDTKDSIVATVDADGNRTAFGTRDLT